MIDIAAAMDSDVLRIRGDFLAIPGLVLTIAQVRRSCGVSAAHARQMLAVLEREGFLVSGGGAYRRSMPSMSD